MLIVLHSAVVSIMQKLLAVFLCLQLNTFGHRVPHSNFDNYFSTPAQTDALQPQLLPPKWECCRNGVVLFGYGGIHTTPGEFPSLALFQYINPQGVTKFSCGGTLISDSYVLTAAHCVQGRILKESGKLYKIRLGEHNIAETKCERGVCDNGVLEMDVGYAIAHGGYDAKHKMHDIALIRLSTAVKEFNSKVSPACLRWTPDSPALEFEANHKFTTVGWGRTLTAKQSNISNKLDIPYFDPEECRKNYARVRINISDAQICAGGGFKKDTCDGDSGGPLFTDVDSCLYLDGIVSFGRGCGLENWPGIYTNVTAYKDWIMTNLEA